MAISDATLEKAQAIQAAHAAAQDRVAARSDLSPAAQQALAARTYITHKAQMDELALSAAGADSIRHGQLTARLFGTDGVAGDRTTNALSLRDAQDRASAIKDPADAAHMLTRAHESGDELLARAVGQHANTQLRDPINNLFGGSNGWGDVLRQFADQRPGSVNDLNELDGINRGNFGSAAKMFAYIVPKPTNLPANDSHIAELAANDQYAHVQ